MAWRTSSRAPSALPSIRIIPDGPLARVEATGAVRNTAHEGLTAALAAWDEGFACEAGVGVLCSAPTVWCSWYHYSTEVRAEDIAEHLAATAETGPADRGVNWDQTLTVLDVTHPGAAAYLTEVFSVLRATGFDDLKIDARQVLGQRP